MATTGSPAFCATIQRAFQRQTLDLHSVIHHLDEITVAKQLVEPLRDVISFLQIGRIAMSAQQARG